MYSRLSAPDAIPSARADASIRVSAKALDLEKIRRIQPQMSNRDRQFLYRYLEKSRDYFEFGSGGSTAQAFLRVPHITSVESDVKWHKFLQEALGFGPNIRWITVDLKVRPHTAGHPGPGSPESDSLNYSRAYRSEFNSDLILIDGRFRVACGFDVWSKITNKTTVIYHDFVPRKHYYIVLNYFDVVEVADTSVALVKKDVPGPTPEMIYYYERQPLDKKMPGIELPPLKRPAEQK